AGAVDHAGWRCVFVSRRRDERVLARRFFVLGKTGFDSGAAHSNTDLWYGTATFPQDSRTDYQIVLNDAQEILDPANPRRRNDGLDYNNGLTMPAFQITDFTRRGKDAPKGAVTDWIVF